MQKLSFCACFTCLATGNRNKSNLPKRTFIAKLLLASFNFLKWFCGIYTSVIVFLHTKCKDIALTIFEQTIRFIINDSFKKHLTTFSNCFLVWWILHLTSTFMTPDSQLHVDFNNYPKKVVRFQKPPQGSHICKPKLNAFTRGCFLEADFPHGINFSGLYILYNLCRPIVDRHKAFYKLYRQWFK